jgi:hypothetical protein
MIDKSLTSIQCMAQLISEEHNHALTCWSTVAGFNSATSYMFWALEHDTQDAERLWETKEMRRRCDVTQAGSSDKHADCNNCEECLWNKTCRLKGAEVGTRSRLISTIVATSSTRTVYEFEMHDCIIQEDQ